MIDIRDIREKPDWVKEQVMLLGDTAPIDEIVEADRLRRSLLTEVEELKRLRNQSAKQVGRWMGQASQIAKQLKKLDRGSDGDAKGTELQAQRQILLEQAEVEKAKSKELGTRIDKYDARLREVEQELNQHMLWVPNMPHSSVPHGPDDSYNRVYEAAGAPIPVFDFAPKPHWDFGPEMSIIDFERGVKLSGSRFYVLKGAGARLQRALIQFMLDFHVEQHGYVEIYPPFMVRSKMFEGAAQLPKFDHNIYRDAEEDFMWLGTAEIALTNLHRDEILEENQLPLNYVAYTACFRREKFSAGRDVRGIKRGHQFDKVEMYKYTTPDASYEALDELVSQASAICEALALPYRLVEMATGDLGFAAAKKYDLEVFAAGCQEWLEVSSCSNCEAFQARRANIRYRPADGGAVRHVHTLNGSGLALPRIMIAILENNQNRDGSITIPDALRPYMGGHEAIPAG